MMTREIKNQVPSGFGIFQHAPLQAMAGGFASNSLFGSSAPKMMMSFQSYGGANSHVRRMGGGMVECDSAGPRRPRKRVEDEEGYAVDYVRYSFE